MNIQTRIFKLLFWLVVLLGTSAQAAEPRKILFVGNSFSFYNNGIHNHYGGLVRASGDWNSAEDRVRLLTLSGGHIHEHLYLLKAYLTDKSMQWDVVVLQGHSTESISKRKRTAFENSLGSLVNLLKTQSIQPVLFMTWGYKGQSDMAASVAEAYIQQALSHDVRVIPVGLAFAASAERYPDIELYTEDVLGIETRDGAQKIRYKRDLKHPSAAGTYLAACIFYASLRGQSPEGNLFHGGLEPAIAATLQKLSWQVVSEFNIVK